MPLLIVAFLYWLNAYRQTKKALAERPFDFDKAWGWNMTGLARVNLILIGGMIDSFVFVPLVIDLLGY